jgi:hypothetical protein
LVKAIGRSDGVRSRSRRPITSSEWPSQRNGVVLWSPAKCPAAAADCAGAKSGFGDQEPLEPSGAAEEALLNPPVEDSAYDYGQTHISSP